MEEDKARYYAIWSALFREFRGWSEEQTRAWAQSKNLFPGDEEKDAWTLFDPPSRPVAWELLPEELVVQVKKIDSKLLLQLEADAENALWPEQFDEDDVDPANVDWLSIRRAWKQVVSDYELKVRAATGQSVKQ